MTITYRARNGAPLTWGQVDENFRTLDLEKVAVRAGYGLSQENFTSTDKQKIDSIPSNLEFRLEQAEDNASEANIAANSANEKASIVLAPDEALKGPGAIPYDEQLDYPEGSAGAAIKKGSASHLFIVRGNLDSDQDKAALESALVSHKNLWLTGQFRLDNSAGPAILINGVDVSITGDAVIEATSDSNDLFRSTGRGFKCTKVSFKGPGTFRPELGELGNPPALLKCTGYDPDVSRCKFIDPYGAGCFIQASAGGRVLFNDFTSSYSGGFAQPFLFHVYLRAASDTIVAGNTLNGHIQGICGGGDSAYTTTGKDGILSSKTRNIMVFKNQAHGQIDHSVYFSNDSENILVGENICSAANAVLKIEGGPNVVRGNRCRGGVGLTGRNVYDTLIEGNVFDTTLSSQFAYGILLSEQVYKRPSKNIKIRANKLTHAAGAVSRAGILVLGEVWDGYQVVLGALDISGNTVIGYGSASGGYGIGINQQLLPGNPVTGQWCEGVTVQGNTVVMPTSTQANDGYFFSNAIRDMAFSGNVAENFRSAGVRSLGVADSNFTGNVLNADPTSTAQYGFFERIKDLTTHFNSTGNRYGGNSYKNCTARTVQHSDETTQNSDRRIIRSTNSAATYTLVPSLWPETQVFTNAPAAAVVNLGGSANDPWPVDRDIIISNAGANSLTVNPGAVSLAAGASARFVCTGGNAFLKI